MAEDPGSERGTPATELPRLLAKLAERSIFFLEQRIALAEDEVRDQLGRGIEAARWLALAVALGIAGSLLVAFGLSQLLAALGLPLWLAQLLLGLALIAGGALVARRASRHGSERRTLQHSLAELEKDRASLAGRS